MVKTERLRVNQVVADNTQQVVVRQQSRVPRDKPPIDQVLYIDRQARVDRVEVITDKVIVEGTVTVHITYVAREHGQPVHHVHHPVTFTGYVEVPGAEPDMDAAVEIRVEDVQVKVDPADPCSFVTVLVLELFAKITEVRDLEVVVHVPPHVWAERTLLRVDDVVGTGAAQAVVSEEFTLPPAKPPIDKVLNVEAAAQVGSVKVIEDKVLVDGTVTLQVLYVAAVPGQPVHELEQEFAFSQAVEVPGARPDMQADVTVSVEKALVEPLPEPVDPRARADVVLSLKVRVTRTRQMNVVTDVRGVAGVRKVRLRVDRVVGEATRQVVLREVAEAPPGKPDVAKVVDVVATDVRVTHVEVLKDKVLWRGFVDLKVVYVADLPDQPVHVFERRLGFSTAADVPGAQPGMRAIIRHTLEFAGGRVVDEKVAVEAVLGFTVKVVEMVQRDVVVGMEEAPPEAPPCPPGAVIHHVIQPGDTFFKLARRYGTTVEAIMRANPGVDPMNLQVGQTIRIPCDDPR
ncbi:MAG: DUF3794 domain-containing protein [Firmicutes bacterium]|nr:DUF3794 domain-containing protein [Bacillota bacterium]